MAKYRKIGFKMEADHEEEKKNEIGTAEGEKQKDEKKKGGIVSKIKGCGQFLLGLVAGGIAVGGVWIASAILGGNDNDEDEEPKIEEAESTED